MGEAYDVIVVGAGVVGASTAFHLAKLGGGKICLIDRSQVCSGGTAKSCAIVRSHYSVPSNTALTLMTLKIFAEFRDWLEDPEAESGFVESGYLILAPEGDLAGRMRANLSMQAGVGAETFEIGAGEARERHPWLELADIALIGYEPRSGYADPYLTTSSFARAARRKGVTVKTGCRVTGLATEGGALRGVETEAGPLFAGQVALAVGPWTAALGPALGQDLNLEISRHCVLTFEAGAPYERTLPVVKDLTTANKMYFRPASGGVVLAGTGDHGDPVETAEALDENVGEDFVLHQGAQIARRMPAFAEARPTASWVGAYDITPDWNPVLGPADAWPNLTLAYGFSGHGFKLAPALGKVLAQSVLGLETEVDLVPYRASRFAEAALLTGSYGIGSIS